MDIFTRFNRKNIQDRQIDTLIGLSKGITADGKVDQAEAEFLMTWLIQNRHSENPIIVNLLEKAESMLADGVLDDEESRELLSLLQKLSGDWSELGEIGKPTSLPLDDPPPAINFENKIFLFTGTFAFGIRRQCQAAIEHLGGLNASGVNKSVNYLILGTYVTDSWVHETYGRKIEKALEYRNAGVPIAIITEEHWVNEAKF